MKWGEYMRNLISYYYQLEPTDIHQMDNYYTFKINDSFYRLQEIRDIKVEDIYDLVIELYQNGIYTHQILKTVTDEFSVTFNQKRYALTIYSKEEEKAMSLDDIYKFQSYLYYIQPKKAKNTSIWGDLWSEKIDYFEYQMNQFGIKYPNIRESFAYYVGLAEVGISLFYAYYSQEEKPILSHKRLKNKNTLYHIYDPFNLVIDYKVRDVAEFFKSLYLDGENILPLIHKYLYDGRLNNYEKMMFFIRMFYPSFYFDVYENIMDNQSDDIILKEIVEKTKDYDKILKFIYNELSLMMSMPYISWLKKSS